MPLDITNWKTPANIIANIIANKLPATFQLGVNLFVGMLPDKPYDSVSIIDTGGGDQDPINSLDEISFQIYSRNKLYQLGYNLQNLIKSELQSIEETTIDSETVLGIWVKSNIAFLGTDSQNNSLFSSNYRTIINTNKNINRN
jgi:hypothetical protein